jgi:hypothetical protein
MITLGDLITPLTMKRQNEPLKIDIRAGLLTLTVGCDTLREQGPRDLLIALQPQIRKMCRTSLTNVIAILDAQK